VSPTAVRAGVAGRRRAAALGRSLTATLSTTPARAFVASRVLIFAAGIAGALSAPRVAGWSGFDAARVSSSFGTVGNLLAAPTVRWDSIWYLEIARHGYTSARSTIFFPLYPLLVHVLAVAAGSYAVAGVLVSCASLAVALALVHRLADLELGRSAADATVLLLAFAPLSLFFSAVYTESLFLALSVGSIYAARRGRWKLACALGGLAAATRVTGVLLVIPLALLRWSGRRRLDRGAAWLALVPAGAAAYAAFLAPRGFSILDPMRAPATWGRHSVGPVAAVAAAVRAAAGGLHALLTGAQPIYEHTIAAPMSPAADDVYLLLVLVLAVACLVQAFRRLPAAYGAYATAAVLACIWSPMAGRPLISFDRYALTIFPLFMAAGAWLAERRLTGVAVAAGAVLLVLCTIDFTTWAFIA
jgi:hypothetical protein